MFIQSNCAEFLKPAMKQFILLTFFSFFALGCFAQGMYGFEFGIGKASISKSYVTPEFTGYCLVKLSRTFYLGGAMSYERYSFDHSYNQSSANVVPGEVISIKQKSSYLFFTPKVDVGIGYRKYYHVFASFGPGILLSGKQWSNKIEPYVNPSGSTTMDTTAIYTANNLPVLVSRYTIGASRRIPTNRYFNLMVSAEYSYIPTNLTTHGPALKTNYFCITIGVMHKYPMVVIED
jgi:hypothetical protein